jgi:HK97 family phage major capsid protein
MNTTTELREKLSAKLDESRAILDRSKGRARTADEERDLQQLNTDMDVIEREIRLAQPTSQGIRPDVGNGAPEVRTKAHPPMLWADKESGRELRSYSMLRGENLADAFGPPAEKAPSLGRMIIGSVTGNWPRGWEAEQRAVQIGIGASGGFVVPDAWGRVIPLAANNSVVLQAGAEVLEMPEGTLKLGRVISDPASNWYGELPTELSLTDPSFGLFTLTAKTLAVRVLCSVQWFEDAPNGAQLVEEAVGRSLGLAFDSAIVNGVASQNLEGLRTWMPGDSANSINEISMGTNGAAITDYSKFVTAVQNILEGNYAGQIEELTAVYAPRTWGTIEGFKEATTNAPLAGPDSFKRLRKLVSTQLPITETQGSANNASTAYVGDFRRLLVGMRKGITIEVTRTGGDAWKRLGVEVRGYVRLDWAVTLPKHFTRIIGIIP